MKHFRLDTICNITQETQELRRIKCDCGFTEQSSILLSKVFTINGKLRLATAALSPQKFETSAACRYESPILFSISRHIGISDHENLKICTLMLTYLHDHGMIYRTGQSQSIYRLYSPILTKMIKINTIVTVTLFIIDAVNLLQFLSTSSDITFAQVRCQLTK